MIYIAFGARFRGSGTSLTLKIAVKSPKPLSFLEISGTGIPGAATL